MPIGRVLADLDSQGWARFSNGELDTEELCGRLGFIIMENDVSIDKGSRSLVRSSKSLPPHTDHHLAHYILWHCHRQDPEGGFSILVDGLRIYDAMSEEEKALLRGIDLMEHCVFKDDLDHHPMIQETEWGLRIYYSFWMADGNLSVEERRAFEAFSKRVKAAAAVKFRLRPGECLIIDNGRVLHGRSSLSVDSDRLLKRYWLGDSELERIRD